MPVQKYTPKDTTAPVTESLTSQEFQDPMPFPIHALPEVMRDMVKETCRAYDVPLALAAPAAISAISVAIGAGVVISSGRGRYLHGNIFSIILAESGSGKGETHKAMFKPIHEWEKARMKRFSEGLATANEVELHLLKERKIAINKEIKAAEGKATSAQKEELFSLSSETKRIEKNAGDDGSMMTRNTTSERLIGMIGVKPSGTFALVSEEAKDPLSVIFGRYRGGGETDESVYLSGYSCEPMSLDRRSEGGSVRADQSCLSIALMTQPSVGRKLFSTMEALESGFFARTLMVDAQAGIGLIDPSRKGFDSFICERWGDLLTEILDDIRDLEGDNRTTINTSEEDIKLLAESINPLISKVQKGLGVNASIASRWAENTFKMALVLHIADGGYDSLARPFESQTMSNALEIMGWYIQQHGFLTSDVEALARKERLQKLIQLVTDSPKGEIAFGVLNRNNYFKEAEIERLVRESKGLLEIDERMTSKPTKFLRIKNSV